MSIKEQETQKKLELKKRQERKCERKAYTTFSECVKLKLFTTAPQFFAIRVSELENFLSLCSLFQPLVNSCTSAHFVQLALLLSMQKCCKVSPQRMKRTQHFRMKNCWTFISHLSFGHFSLFTELKARITGPAEVFVKSGSEITLTCKLQQNPHDLGTIFWKKGE